MDEIKWNLKWYGITTNKKYQKYLLYIWNKCIIFPKKIYMYIFFFFAGIFWGPFYFIIYVLFPAWLLTL